MITLHQGVQAKDKRLLTIVKKLNINLWNVYIGNWYVTGQESVLDDIEYQTTEEVVMSAKDLKRFAKEVRRMLKKKPRELTTLRLTVKKNKPQFKVLMRYGYPKEPYELIGNPLYRPELDPSLGNFEFMPAINVHYAGIVYSRPEDADMYEHGGRHIGPARHFTEEDLKKFADDLETEVSLGL